MTADQCSKCAHYMPTIDGLCSMCRPKPDPLIGTWRVWKEPYPFALRDAWKGRPFVLLDRFHIRYAGDVHAIAWDDSIAATHSRPATTLEVFEAWYASDPRVTAHAPAVTDPRVGAVKIAAVDDADVYWIGGGAPATHTPGCDGTYPGVCDAHKCRHSVPLDRCLFCDRVACLCDTPSEDADCNCDQARELRAELERVTAERDALADTRWLDTYNAALSGGAGNFAAAFADVAHGKRGTR